MTFIDVFQTIMLLSMVFVIVAMYVLITSLSEQIALLRKIVSRETALYPVKHNPYYEWEMEHD